MFFNRKHWCSIYIFCVLIITPLSLTTSKSNSNFSSILDQKLKFDHYKTKQGLSQNSVYTILQDEKGFLWFGTQDGLNRFNGYSFIVFHHDAFDTTSLCHSYINKIYEDAKERMWICTEGGLAQYNQLTETFTNYLHDNSNPLSMISNYVWTICQDKSGLFWVGTKKGLCLFDPAKNTFVKINLPSEDKWNDPFEVSTLTKDSHDNIWIGTHNHGIFKIDRTTKKNVSPNNLEFTKYDIGNDQVSTIVEDSNGDILIGTQTNGLLKFNIEKNVFIPDSLNLLSITNNKLKIRTIYCDQSNPNLLWIGTEENGLLVLDRKLKLISKFTNNAHDETTISGNMVNTIFRSRAGLIWIGTNEGINRLNLNSNSFECIAIQSKGKPGLSSNTIGKIIEDRDGTVWIGTDGGGINKFDRTKNTITHYLKNNNASSLSSNRAMNVFEDHTGTLWIGTYGDGLNKFNKQKNTFKHYKHDNYDSTSIGSDYITSIVEDKSGYLWIGTTTGGINRFDPKTGKFRRFVNNPHDSKSLSENHVWILFIDSYGVLWAGTKSGGLNKMIDMQKGIFESFHHDDKKITGINHNSVHAIFEDHKGRFWLGTPAGLNLLDRKSGMFFNFKEKRILSQLRVIGILEDDQNRLWLMSEKSLIRFDPQTGVIKYFDSGNGMMISDFRIWANYKNRKGELYVGGANGLAIFRPDELKDNNYIPPIIIDKFERYNTDNSLGNVISEKGIPYRKRIDLSYKDNIFSFSFSALNYINSERNQYAYKLKGFNNDWIKIGSEKKVTFTNIDPGNYTFMVKGSNNEGVWNEAGTSIALYIAPPYWRTWWFRTIGFLIIVFTLYIMRKKKLVSVEKHHKEQEAFARQLIETEESERRRIANELHDSLGQNLLVIKNILLVKMQQSQIEGKSLSDTSTLVSQTLEEVRSISHNLRPHLLDQLGLTKTIKSLVNQLNETAEVNITAEIDDLSGVLDPKAEISLFRIIQECFNNIIKHSKAKQAKIVIKRLADSIKVEIKDNGKGIDEIEMKKHEEFGQGFGLYGMKKRAHVFNWVYEIHSTPNKGTEIILIIPIEQDLIK